MSRALVFAIVASTIACSAAALGWCVRNRGAASWDESAYQNRIAQDVQLERANGFVRAARLTRWTDTARPPAYRLAALPLTTLFGPSLLLLRVASLLALLGGSVLLFGAVRSLTSPGVAATTAAVWGLSYAPLWASAHFGTEYVLYGSVVLLFSTLLACGTHPERAGTWTVLGIAVAIALGALSKSSFLLIGGPAVAAFLALGWWQRLPRRALGVVLGGAVLGAAIAVPWWIVNAHSAFAYAVYASQFERHGLPWLPAAFFTLTGPPVTVLVVGVLAMVAWRYRRVLTAFTPEARLAVVTCLAGGLPLFAAHLLGINHNMRLVSPALLPMLVALALLVEGAGLATPLGLALAAATVVLQAGYMTRVFTTSTIDEWNWDGLYALVESHGLREPLIEHLGNGITFNPAAIEWPWISRGQAVREEWIWRFEQGPIDWRRVGLQADSADVLVTAPAWPGDPRDQQPLDNEYNREFERRLMATRLFDPPDTLRLGTSHTLVLVFFRRLGRHT